METYKNDAPITSPDQDLLGRNGYAEYIARTIINLPCNSNTVVGIDGKWGDGKTSIQNLIIHRIENLKPDNIVIKKFNPWIFNSQEKLTQQFYEILFEAYGSKNKFSSEQTVKLQKYYESLHRGRSDTLSAAITYLKIAIPSIAVVLYTLGIYINKTIAALAILFVAMPTQLFHAAKSAYHRTLGAEADYAKDISLQKDRLQEALKKSNKKIIIFIDDIDRLSAKEVCLLFQLVKNQADFNNITYILCMDTSVVAKYLGDEYKDGYKFLEKIIQIPTKIPLPDKTKLFTLLFDELINIITMHAKLHYNRDRMINSIYSYILPTTTNLRDVKRALNAFSLTINSISLDNISSINATDAFCLEYLYLTDKDLYQLVRENKDIFTTSHTSNNEKQNPLKAYVANTIKESTPTSQQIIYEVFPNILPLTSTESIEIDTNSEYMISEKRACNATHFDYYFTTHNPETELSDAAIERLSQECSNVSSAKDALIRLISESKLESLALKIKAHIPLLDDNKRIKLASACTCIAETKRPGRSVSITSYDYLRQITRLLLTKTNDDSFKTLETLRSIHESTKSTILLLNIADGLTPTISDSLVKRSLEHKTKRFRKKVLLQAIDNIFNDKYLYFGNINLMHILFLAKKHLTLIDTKKLTSCLITNTDDAILFLSSLVIESTSSTGWSETKRVQLITKKSLIALIDTDYFNSILEHTPVTSDDSIRILTMYKDALVRDENEEEF